ncbi:uncharacterized protein [Triticum aestivum]|uniref:uncharacterized protein n=1 Tax=Triticum aestivum TaxID=4565 RepID=UPI001D00C77B|nr:uncharacterized protein LOC123042365 [Triticum aestivum]
MRRHYFVRDVPPPSSVPPRGRLAALFCFLFLAGHSPFCSILWRALSLAGCGGWPPDAMESSPHLPWRVYLAAVMVYLRRSPPRYSLFMMLTLGTCYRDIQHLSHLPDRMFVFVDISLRTVQISV